MSARYVVGDEGVVGGVFGCGAQVGGREVPGGGEEVQGGARDVPLAAGGGVEGELEACSSFFVLGLGAQGDDGGGARAKDAEDGGYLGG